MRIGRITVSDRASAGVYADRSGPEIEQALRGYFPEAGFEATAVPDEPQPLQAALLKFIDGLKLDLVVTTGGTGISPRDITPETTRAILEKELPGFGEAMRFGVFARVRTAILSRATAGVRGRTLVINLPGKPRAVRECLEILAPAIVEGLAHLKGEDPHRPALEQPAAQT